MRVIKVMAIITTLRGCKELAIFAFVGIDPFDKFRVKIVRK
jgi:hypothetical protein